MKHSELTNNFLDRAGVRIRELEALLALKDDQLDTNRLLIEEQKKQIEDLRKMIRGEI